MPAEPPLNRLIRTYALRERRAGLLASTFLTVGLVATLAYPQAMKRVIDGLLNAEAASSPRWLLVLVALLLVEATTRVAHGLILHGAASRISLAVERATFERLLLQPISFFDDEKSVEMSAHLRSSSETLRDFIARELPDLLRAFLRAITGSVALVLTAPRLALFLAVVAPPLVALTSWLARAVKMRSQASSLLGAQNQAAAQESFGAIRATRSLGVEVAESQRFSVGSQSAHQGHLALGRLASWADGASLLLSESVTLVAVGVGGKMVADGFLTVGELVSFLIYADLTARAIRDLTRFRAQAAMVRGALAPLGELMSRTQNDRAGERNHKGSGRGAIALEDVHFSYPRRPAIPVLRGLTLRVDPGECLALVGESGAGKSTVLALMAGFYAPAHGRVLLDGVPPDRGALGWQTGHLAYVPQGGRAFSRSIRENLLLGRDVTDETLAEAIAIAGLDPFVSRIQGGLEAMPGESGAQISGGEAERLALARAMCGRPSVLLLDEATAALDPESEAAILDALRSLASPPTLVIVSHRLSTIQSADRIAVLAAGQVEAVGRHDDLVRESSAYRRFLSLGATS